MMDVRHTTLFKTLIMVGVMGTGLSMTAQNAQAQTPPENVLLAQNDGIAPQNSAEDDIFAAMKALDEVGAMIEEAKRTPAKEAPSIDIHALVTAASTEDAPVVAPKHDVQTAPAVAAKPEVAKPQAVAPKHDVRPDMSQTIPFSLAYILDVYKVNGVDLAAKTSARSTAELYQYAFKQKSVYHTSRPAIGDLAFFHNTADRNRDGRWNDWHSLIGIVESIDDQDTITILVFTSQLERIKLNLKYPELHKSKKGDILNSQLRPNEGSQVGTSAKLFAGFANLLGDVPSVTVIDNWKPGMKF